MAALFHVYFTTLAGWIGTTASVLELIVAAVLIIVIIAAISHYANMAPGIVFIVAIILMILFAAPGIEWMPWVIPLFVFFVALAYIIWSGGFGSAPGVGEASRRIVRAPARVYREARASRSTRSAEREHRASAAESRRMHERYG